MRIFRTTEEFKKWRTRQQRKKIGFVPTMGALHEGHLSLVERAAKETDLVVVSIFVNPTQFGPNEDFKKYPRTERNDLNLLKDLCDAVFIPRSPSEIYGNDISMRVYARPSLASILCGRFRPGHFDGVCTVVYKLFSIVRPQSAFFGEMDYQQLKIIEALVEDLNLFVRIVPCPTLRAESGLALSSRNAYLSEKDRHSARVLYELLRKAPTTEEAKRRLQSLGFKVQYVEDWNDELSERGGQRWLAAAYFKDVRLIDNVLRPNRFVDR